MRPPLDPDQTYTVLSASAARRKLQREGGMPRHQTAGLTLDQLHDSLSTGLPPQVMSLVVVVTDRAFSRITEELDRTLRRLAGRPVNGAAPLLSRSAALKRLGEVITDTVPDDATELDLEDALAGLNGLEGMDGERPTILPDDDFATYGAEAHRLLSAVASGRAA